MFFINMQFFVSKLCIKIEQKDIYNKNQLVESYFFFCYIFYSPLKVDYIIYLHTFIKKNVVAVPVCFPILHQYKCIFCIFLLKIYFYMYVYMLICTSVRKIFFTILFLCVCEWKIKYIKISLTATKKIQQNLNRTQCWASSFLISHTSVCGCVYRQHFFLV